MNKNGDKWAVITSEGDETIVKWFDDFEVAIGYYQGVEAESKRAGNEDVVQIVLVEKMEQHTEKRLGNLPEETKVSTYDWGEPITDKQRRVVNMIQENLDVVFFGTTKQQASNFISEYIGESKRADDRHLRWLEEDCNATSSDLY